MPSPISGTLVTPATRTSSGVLITDGVQVLLGHASRSPPWDITEGTSRRAVVTAAIRELNEETSLLATPDVLRPLGTHVYLRDKDLALFAWLLDVLPDPAVLQCVLLVKLPGGKSMPELDRFGRFTLDASVAAVGRSLARVLTAVWPMVSK
jgi:8-oxo-dGTP pyrophosphatase MutT (NUDIX family)